MGIGLSSLRLGLHARGVFGGPDADAAAFFARMSTTPTAEFEAALETFIRGLKSAGVYSGLSRLYVLGGATQADNHLNIINTDGTLSVSGAGSITLDAGEGEYGDGAAGLSAGDLATSILSQTNSQVTFFTTKTGNMQAAGVGLLASSNNFILTRESTRTQSRFLNAASVYSNNVPAGVGVCTFVRTSTEIITYVDGVEVSRVASTPSTIPSQIVAFGRHIGSYSTDRFFGFMIGEAVDAAGAAAINTRFRALAAALGWVAPPTITAVPLTPTSTTVYPDGASNGTTGKGFTCTGLVKDAEDGTWWVSNYGLALPTDPPPIVGSVVHLSSDFSTILDEFLLAADLGLPSGSQIQGITEDTSDNTIFFALSAGTVVHMSKAGAVLDSFSATCNGISYDYDSDCLVINGLTTLYRANKTTGAFIGLSYRMPMEMDQCHYIGDGRVLLFHGTNSYPGFATLVDLDSDWGYPALIKQFSLGSALSMEGGYLDGDTLYVNSDELFHIASGTPTNNVLTYDMTGLL